jgi:uncharacterized protein (TIGR02147 family)
MIPDIYCYSNFREYLADFQIARYKTDTTFSKSNFSRLLGLPNTRSYFTDVLKGKKVTTAFTERFINILALDEIEAKYFRVLVKYDQAETSEEKQGLFNQLLALNNVPKRILDSKAIEYYSNWYCCVIRATLDIIDFIDDFTFLANKVFPAITALQAREAIDLLLILGLIKKNEKGFYKPTDKSISTPESMDKDALLKQYQKKCIQLSIESISTKADKPHTIATNLMSLSESGHKKLEESIERFRNEVRSLVLMDQEPADRIYQMVIQLFPSSS